MKVVLRLDDEGSSKKIWIMKMNRINDEDKLDDDERMNEGDNWRKKLLNLSFVSDLLILSFVCDLLILSFVNDLLILSFVGDLLNVSFVCDLLILSFVSDL